MDEYNLTPDVIKEHLTDLQLNAKKDPLEGVTAQTKALLTRTYNQRHKSSIKAIKTKKNIGADGAVSKRFNEEAGSGDEANMSENEADNEEV